MKRRSGGDLRAAPHRGAEADEPEICTTALSQRAAEKLTKTVERKAEKEEPGPKSEEEQRQTNCEKTDAGGELGLEEGHGDEGREDTHENPCVQPRQRLAEGRL